MGVPTDRNEDVGEELGLKSQEQDIQVHSTNIDCQLCTRHYSRC